MKGWQQTALIMTIMVVIWTLSIDTDSDDDEIIEPDAGESTVDVQTESNSFDLPDTVPYPRMLCMTHILQLTIKKAYVHYDSLLIKVRPLGGRVTKSSVAVGKHRAMCGKMLISDNSTKWNSTHAMIKRLLELKTPLKDVLSEAGIDSLLVVEWSRLQELCSLLEPFSAQTDTLQTDTVFLSLAIPASLSSPQRFFLNLCLVVNMLIMLFNSLLV